MEYGEEVGFRRGTLRQTCVFLGLSLAETGSLGHAVQLSLPCRLDRFINALLCEGSLVANRDTSFT